MDLGQQINRKIQVDRILEDECWEQIENHVDEELWCDIFEQTEDLIDTQISMNVVNEILGLVRGW